MGGKLDYCHRFLIIIIVIGARFIFRGVKMKNLQNMNVKKKLGKKIVKNMLPTSLYVL